MQKTDKLSKWVYRLLILLIVGLAIFSTDALTARAVRSSTRSSIPSLCTLRSGSTVPSGFTKLDIPSSIDSGVQSDLGGSGISTKFYLDCGSTAGTTHGSVKPIYKLPNGCHTVFTLGNPDSILEPAVLDSPPCEDGVTWDFSKTVTSGTTCTFKYTSSAQNTLTYHLRFLSHGVEVSNPGGGVTAIPGSTVSATLSKVDKVELDPSGATVDQKILIENLFYSGCK